MTPTQAVIYPEAISRPDLDKKSPGPWSVQHDASQGYSMLDKKVIVAPLIGQPCAACGHDHAKGIRQHEMAHVAFTPTNLHSRAKRAKVSHDIMQGVEDARIGWRLERDGMPAAVPICPESVGGIFAPALSRQDFPYLISKIAAGYCTPETRTETQRWINETMAADDDLYQLRDVRYYLERLQSGRPDSKRGLETMKRLQGIADQMTRAAQQRAQAQADAQAQQAQSAMQQPDGKGAKGAHVNVPGSGTDNGSGSGHGWFDMEIEEPRRDRPARKMPIRRWSHRDEGCIPSAMHRLVSDGRIFRVPSHKMGNVVLLIDGSSSMRWDMSDLQALLDAAPVSTVAIYGRHSSRKDGVAQLRILAKNGRRVDDEHITSWSFGSNSCDGLALRWAAKQPGKRIWLSDGEVNGLGDFAALHDDARAVIFAGEIMRVDTPAEAIAVASGKARHIPSRRGDPYGSTVDNPLRS